MKIIMNTPNLEKIIINVVLCQNDISKLIVIDSGIKK